MKRGLLLVAGVLAMLSSMVQPAKAEDAYFATKILAEARQILMPVGPHVWQAVEARLTPASPALVRGEDIGFDFVIDGALVYESGEGGPKFINPGEAAANVSGLQRSIFNAALDSTLFWHIGLGGPTPSISPLESRLVFQSEPLIPPGNGPYDVRLAGIEVYGAGTIPATTLPGYVTLFVIDGAARVTSGIGGAVLRAGFGGTLPSDAPINLQSIGNDSALILAIAYQQADAPGIPSNLAPVNPEYAPRQLTPNLPLLPSGNFPRSKPYPGRCCQ